MDVNVFVSLNGCECVCEFVWAVTCLRVCMGANLCESIWLRVYMSLYECVYANVNRPEIHLEEARDRMRVPGQSPGGEVGLLGAVEGGAEALREAGAPGQPVHSINWSAFFYRSCTLRQYHRHCIYISDINNNSLFLISK